MYFDCFRLEAADLNGSSGRGRTADQVINSDELSFSKPLFQSNSSLLESQFSHMLVWVWLR